MAALLFHATLSDTPIELRLAAPPSHCTAAAAAVALDDWDDLLQAIDDWLATELDWRWQAADTPCSAYLSPSDGAVAAASRGVAIAEVVHVDPATPTHGQLALPWALMRQAGAPPPPLATRLRWQDAPAHLTLAGFMLEPEELAAIEPGGAIVLAEDMHGGRGWLHAPGEPPERGLAVAVGALPVSPPNDDRGTAAPMPAPGTAACEVRLVLPPSLPASMLAGWCGLEPHLGDLTRKPAQAWLVDPQTRQASCQLANGRLIPWGWGWAMLFDEVARQTCATKV